MLHFLERKALFVTGVIEISKYARQQRMYIVSCQSTYHQLLSDSGSTLKGVGFEGEHRMLALQTSQSCQLYVLALPIWSNVKKGCASEAYVEPREVFSVIVKGLVVEINKLLCMLRIAVLALMVHNNIHLSFRWCVIDFQRGQNVWEQSHTSDGLEV